jgi:Cu/Ag efflux pump CusA
VDPEAARRVERREHLGGGCASAATPPAGSRRIILEASLEVRSAIFYATLINVLAVVPVLVRQSVTGSFVEPLAVSYALAILASREPRTIPGVRHFGSHIGQASGAAEPIVVRIFGADPKTLKSRADRVRHALSNVDGLEDQHRAARGTPARRSGRARDGCRYRSRGAVRPAPRSRRRSAEVRGR